MSSDSPNSESVFDVGSGEHIEALNQIVSEQGNPHSGNVYAADWRVELSVSLVPLAADALEAVVRNTFSRQLNLMAKRCIDIALSSTALVLLSPFLLLIAWLVKFESVGPAIFVQDRWGLGCSKIRIYKFRTMYAHKCDTSGVTQTVLGDERVTTLGRFLRRTSIDELPQLLNVLRGELSLVGPRCHAVGMIASGVLYEELVPEYHTRHLVRPGITGLAQVKGYRGQTANVELATRRVEYDLRYITQFDAILDLKILFLTVVRELFGGTGS